jgi:hypothetical protein
MITGQDASEGLCGRHCWLCICCHTCNSTHFTCLCCTAMLWLLLVTVATWEETHVLPSAVLALLHLLLLLLRIQCCRCKQTLPLCWGAAQPARTLGLLKAQMAQRYGIDGAEMHSVPARLNSVQCGVAFVQSCRLAVLLMSAFRALQLTTSCRTAPGQLPRPPRSMLLCATTPPFAYHACCCATMRMHMMLCSQLTHSVTTCNMCRITFRS